jgi:hypothetical protein
MSGQQNGGELSNEKGELELSMFVAVAEGQNVHVSDILNCPFPCTGMA